MLTTLLMSLSMFPDSFHRGIDLPPDEFYQIHALSCLLQGLGILPDHLPDPNLNNQGPKSHLKSMMALFTFHLKSINF